MAQIDQLSAQVSHAIDLQKVANQIALGESSALDELAQAIREILLANDIINTKKLRDQIIKDVLSEVDNTTTNVIDSITSKVDDVIREEVAFQYSVANAISSAKIIRSKLSAFEREITNTPLVLNGKGITWDERIGSFRQKTLEQAKQIVIAGWQNGTATADIARQLTGTRTSRGLIDVSKSSANAMVKDLISHTSSMTKAKLAKDNADIIIGEQATVTLDSRTSPICRGYSSGGGKKWYYETDGKNFPRPPYHFRCRTTMRFIIAPEYDLELESTRPAVVDGKAIQVDKDTDWYSLAKRYPPMAEQALGKTRAHLLESMSTEEFYKVAYNSLNEYQTINEMIERSKKVARLLKE